MPRHCRHTLVLSLQISDGIYKHIAPYQGPETGKAVSLEFALFTTAVVLLVGGSACLLATLTVEKDRKVGRLDLNPDP